MTPSTSLQQLTTADGIKMNVVSACAFTWKGNDRVSFTCKRPRGRRLYVVIGYENGTFSKAA